MSLRLTDAQFAALAGVSSKKIKQDTLIADGYRSKWRGTSVIGGKTCKFRSLWEHNYACYLEFLKKTKAIKDWKYEPKKFEFPMIYKTTPFSYLIDFQVFEWDDSYRWHEVKGVMNPKSKKKIKRFEKHYPEEGKILVIGKDWFKRNGQKFSKLIPGWTRLQNAHRL
jgi:hypothetical protein